MGKPKRSTQIAERFMILYPTGKCFDDAIELIDLIVKRGQLKQARGLIVVHAICINPDTGQRFAHAWVEDRCRAWQAGILHGKRVWIECNKDDYIARLRPQRMTRYTIESVIEHNQHSGHCGPWEPEYAALCKVGS